jgi:hypothetical protein
LAHASPFGLRAFSHVANDRGFMVKSRHILDSKCQTCWIRLLGVWFVLKIYMLPPMCSMFIGFTLW